MYYIGLLLLLLIVVPYFLFGSKRKKSIEGITNIQPVDDNSLKEAAMRLPGLIEYEKKERNFCYRGEIRHIINTISKFYTNFDSGYEEYIEQSRELLNNRLQVQSSLKNILGMKNKKYRIPASVAYDENSLEAAVSYFLQLCACKVNEQNIADFLASYQFTRTMKYNEIFVFMDIVNIKLIQRLARICSGILKETREYAKADGYVRRLDESPGELPGLENEIEDIVAKKPYSYLVKLNMALMQQGASRGGYYGVFVKACREQGINIDNISLQMQKRMSETSVLAANIISSLRSMVNINMQKFIKKVSYSENVLLKDPAGVYDDMTEDTKSLYRFKVEQAARDTGRSEFEVAAMSLKLARENDRHIGAYIINESDRAVLYKALGSRHGARTAKCRVFHAAVAAATLLITCVFAFYLKMSGAGAAVSAALALVTVPVFYKVAFYLAGRAACRLLPGNKVPAIQLDCVPKSAKTTVIIPVLATGEEQMGEVVKTLELTMLSNDYEGLNFAIVADYKASDKQQPPGDEELGGFVREQIRRLNDKYGKRFYFFSRGKSYRPQTGLYECWERKRGALLEFNKMLLEGSSQSFGIDELDENIKGTKYVITLDEDTRAAPGELLKMIGAMHHPLNKPVIEGGRVVSGYAILQPVMRVLLEDASRSFFTRVFSGGYGYSHYCSGAAALSMKLYKKGVYFGKGIYSPKEFNEVLWDAFPDNWILSHDHIEGDIAGCGAVDATMYEGFPRDIKSYFKRYERWLRGDWQVMPWLCGLVKNRNLTKVKNSVLPCARMRMLGDMISSLAAPTAYAGLVLSMLTGFLMQYAAFIMLPVILLRAAEYLICFVKYGKLSRALLLETGKNALELALMPYKAVISIKGIYLALYRMATGSPKLMQWSTAASTDKGRGSNFFLMMWPSYIIVAVAVVSAMLWPGQAVFLSIAALFFLALVFTAHEADKTECLAENIPNEEQKEFLSALAKKTYRYFEKYCDKTTGLVSDNYQEKHGVGAAKRTSPTNIGYSLISHCAALDMGIISRDKFVLNMERTVATLKKLEKWNGNLFNWYDISDGSLLFPRYVSMVDSGNLKACLIFTFEFLKRLNDIQSSDLPGDIKHLIETMDISKLYDESKTQYYIGYNMETGSFSNSHYDLYMSESRLTSLVEIASGNAPGENWDSLCRNDVCINSIPVVMSWGGSTFEYLMPSLFLPVYPHSFEEQAVNNYIKLQYEYCEKKGVPLGISESSYIDEDMEGNYQYRSFGVPGTGYRRDIETDVVCAPYAALLALEFMPERVMDALYQFVGIGASGSCGFYEAVDFTKRRLDGDRNHEVISSYMAHHQGMIMASIYNYLYDNTIKKTLMGIPCMQTIELILQEPRINACHSRVKLVSLKNPPSSQKGLINNIAAYNNLEPLTHYPTGVLSNGAYRTGVAIDGSGGSNLEEFMLTRSSESAADNKFGTFAFIYGKGSVYSFTRSIGKKAERESFRINISSLKFSKRFNDFLLENSIHVDANENIEVRKYTVTNMSDKPKTIGMNIYSDIAMSPPEAYRAHRAYQNLFVESRMHGNGILFIRRKRYSYEKTPCLVWSILGVSEKEELSFSNDREKAIGRYNTIENAVFHTQGIGFTKNAVEHCALAQTEMILKASETRTVYLIQTAGFSEQDCIALAQKYDNINIVEHLISKIGPAQRARLKYNMVDTRHLRLYNKLVPALLYEDAYSISCKDNLLKNRLSRNRLWRIGISGDKPVIIANIYNEGTLPRLEHMFKVAALILKSGIEMDFIVVNHITGDYENRVRDAIYSLKEFFGGGGHVKVLGSDMMNVEEFILLKAMAAAEFNMNIELITQFDYFIDRRMGSAIGWRPTSLVKPYLLYGNGYGGFDEETDDYIINIKDGIPTPLPWCNILTNGSLGAILSEKGISYMWYKNSREMPLTKWRNDAITDNCPVRIKMYSGDSLIYEFGSSAPAASWQVRHSRGYSVYSVNIDGLSIKITVFICIDSNIMLMHTDIYNSGSADCEIGTELECRLVMGDATGRNVIVSCENGVSHASNYVNDNMNQVTFSAACERLEAEQPDEQETPGGVIKKRYHVSIKPGRRQEYSFVLGTDEIKPNINRRGLLAELKSYWNKRTGVIKVKTPDTALDIMINSYLQYQTISSRVMGRCGYYQCGGAFGFRDQLQDAISLLWASPMVIRNILVEFAGHQFLSGDVQHWWHAPYKGVRTRIKDDMLFLPYGVCEYIEHTQDYSILDEEIRYLEDVEIPPGKDDWYGSPPESGVKESLMKHCIRAVERCCDFGRHGLPLMGGGDWNDGMNKVGCKGSGESVWLGFFLYYVMKRLYRVLMAKGEHTEGEIMMERLNRLKIKLHDSSWDGRWYKRAYFDDGTPLGSAKCEECRIDCLSQSWAVISGIADQTRGNMALDSALEELYDENNDILDMIKPAFDSCNMEPGYIKGYIPGVRENGAQYTHAALWLVWALTRMERGADACRLFRSLNPINHSLTKEAADKYKGEPYVVAADVYSCAGQEGRVGWTWYTGSAAWMYKIGVENILGLRKSGDKLFINPCIDPKWPGYEIRLRYVNTYYYISVKNPGGEQSGIKSLVLDGKEVLDGFINLINDAGEHRVYVVM